ncbi:YfhE family protein [Mangrovibacillus cuniculi]|uniref:YfhE family protein n=1 Tax=Mangrovibacillus cuniculi TaxID=2593652 RepID=A0A7S8HES1_9BACI|nr:YfhE family protein [Mangrovibacillus cuniculi]QPC45771.1 YfhE family protein [Mangrovibacillus cuniculi]
MEKRYKEEGKRYLRKAQEISFHREFKKADRAASEASPKRG